MLSILKYLNALKMPGCGCKRNPVPLRIISYDEAIYNTFYISQFSNFCHQTAAQAG